MKVDMTLAVSVPYERSLNNGQPYGPDTGRKLLHEMINCVHLQALGQGEKLKSSYDYPVQFWRLGEQKLVVLSSERKSSVFINIPVCQRYEEQTYKCSQ